MKAGDSKQPDGVSRAMTDLVPDVGVGIDWNAIESAFRDAVLPMKATPQDPLWHGEGDVWTHTKMVCEALVALPYWQAQTPRNRFSLFFAALLHDSAKPVCTKKEDGRIVSPKHAERGARMTRRRLWETFGLAGTRETMELREDIVALIRRHTLPYHILDRPDSLRDVVSVSVTTGCESLATLCEADIRGRISNARTDSLEQIALFRQLADENDCLGKPYDFASDCSRYAYFSGVLEHPAQRLYDDSWGEVVLLSGLPASGKDFHAAGHYADLPVVSLDDLRRRMNVSWFDDQTPVINAAREKAKELLRRRRSFVWNATNLRRELRRPILRLCADYGARVRIVYLEADLPTLYRRNRERENPVDESAYGKMLDFLDPPTILEATNVERIAT